MHSQLLLTFTDKDTVKTVIEEIYQTYHLVYNFVYILQDKTNLNELFITYNIDSQFRPEYPLRNTILVHRKKESNSLYTINALNQLVREENNGVLDRNYMIDWNKYRNTIILTNTLGTKKIPTRIFEIIELNKK